MNDFIFENYQSKTISKDGGFIFQAVVSHEIKWEIEDGETKLDLKKINSFLHRLDVFPDMEFTEGFALSTYVILSEINLLKRKFELASEAIKKRVNPEYLEELQTIKNINFIKKKDISKKYFNNTYFEVSLKTNKIVLREVSSSSLDSGLAQITLKISTGLVDNLDGKRVGTWDKIDLSVTGNKKLYLSNSTQEKLSEIKEYDEIENTNDIVFRTIIPSLVIQLKGKKTIIDTYSNRSPELIVGSIINYDNIFN